MYNLYFSCLLCHTATTDTKEYEYFLTLQTLYGLRYSFLQPSSNTILVLVSYRARIFTTMLPIAHCPVTPAIAILPSLLWPKRRENTASLKVITFGTSLNFSGTE